MQVLLVRHAPAEDRAAFARSGGAETERPLTEDGKHRMKRAARGLRCLVPEVSGLWSSPLRRAAETAAILSATWGLEARHTAALGPGGDGAELERLLRRSRGSLPRVLVGHEPDLGSLLAGWLTGRASSSSWIGFKKGGAALVEFTSVPRQGAGQLLWLLPPGALRHLEE